MTKVQLRYWDTACFIAWLQHEPDRFDDCETVIRAAERGQVRIVTSSLSIAEVVRLKGVAPIPRDAATKVRLFFRQEYIVVRQLDRFLAEEAQELVWDHGVMPKDAIHVATAIREGVAQFDTFDEPLIARSGTIGNPPLVIGRPFVAQQLELDMDESEGTDADEGEPGEDSSVELRLDDVLDIDEAEPGAPTA